ncbi:MAG: cellulase family glycosylhydrolase, partial [Bacteroidales bacterium]|nr:cellulase family glycosylhydrolase [Bacteroidales bacterium]
MKKYLFKTNSGSKTLLVGLLLFLSFSSLAWEGMPMSRLHVEGRYLKDPHGNIVNLHGFAQTYSPWFNEEGRKWSNYDVNACLNYNKGIIDGIMKAGWKVNFIRLHMDPYWSNNPGVHVTGENDISAFNLIRFKSYLNSVFVPMAQYAISKGLYVIMRPPGVCPEKIAVGDAYNVYMKKVWATVAQNSKLKNNPYIMFELANEPVNILGKDGTYGAGSQGHFDNLKTYFQSVVDTIRTHADNILWVPGLGYQSLYSGYAVNPIEGENIGYAVHVYPGWFNSGQGYAAFQNGWNSQVKPVADFAPVVVTEMDWAPAKYNKSWGKDVTGVAGGDGFGANFQKITDKSGNVSWLIFTGPDLLAQFKDIPLVEGEEPTFWNDPEACPWPAYHWYQEYTKTNYARPDYVNVSTKDNGDNSTFANPVLAADFPNPIVVQSGNTFYLVSTNPNRYPATTVLESNDLVNWAYSSQPVDSVPLQNKILVDENNLQAGTMVQTSAGQWWAMVSYDKGALGQFPSLLPVSMVDGKPVVDETVKESLKIKKPNVRRGYIATYLPTNDAFRHYKLGLQWAWTKKVDHSQWSLAERAGYMRLKTGAVVDSLHNAQNILTQRILSFKQDTVYSFGTIRMEIKGMKEGDVAGLSVMNKEYGYIGVTMSNGEKKLVTCVNKELQSGLVLSDSVVYLRGVVNKKTGKA